MTHGTPLKFLAARIFQAMMRIIDFGAIETSLRGPREVHSCLTSRPALLPTQAR